MTHHIVWRLMYSSTHSQNLYYLSENYCILKAGILNRENPDRLLISRTWVVYHNIKEFHNVTLPMKERAMDQAYYCNWITKYSDKY